MAATAHCPRCTAQLRRDQPMGSVCDPCRKAGHTTTRLPLEFFDSPPLRSALAGYQFGVLFRRARAFKNWSQGTLGDVLDMPQTTISEVERGRRAVIDIKVIVKIHNRLGVPAALLGFTDLATVSPTTWKGGSWVERRDFVQSVAAVAFSAPGATGLDIGRLVALLYPDATGTRQRRRVPGIYTRRLGRGQPHRPARRDRRRPHPPLPTPTYPHRIGGPRR